MHNPFDSGRIAAYAKENHILTDRSQSRIGAKLRPQPIEFRAFGYFLHPRAKQTKRSQCMAWTVLGDVVRDLFKVAWDKRGQAKTHYRAAG